MSTPWCPEFWDNVCVWGTSYIIWVHIKWQKKVKNATHHFPDPRWWLQLAYFVWPVKGVKEANPPIWEAGTKWALHQFYKTKLVYLSHGSSSHCENSYRRSAVVLERTIHSLMKSIPTCISLHMCKTFGSSQTGAMEFDKYENLPGRESLTLSSALWVV